MRSKAIIISIILHITVGAIALQFAAKEQVRRKAVAISVADKKNKQKQASPNNNQEKKPKRKPVASPRPAPAPKALPTGVTPPSTISKGSADGDGKALDTGIALDNGGDDQSEDIALGGSGVVPTTGREVETKRAEGLHHKKRKPLPPKSDEPTEEQCLEPPTKPVPVSRPTEIEYTTQARANGIEGRLVLRIIVNKEGAVERVEVVNSVDSALDAAAIAAVKTWVFKPSQRCGKPIAGGTYMLARRFELGD